MQRLSIMPIIIGGLLLCSLVTAEDPRAQAVNAACGSDSPAPPLVQQRNTDILPRIIHREDLVYGKVNGAGLLADIAFPNRVKQKGPRLPAIISVHGGRWQSGNKRDASAIDVMQWAELGFFAMSIDYRLVGCSAAPACYQDLQCAIRYLHAHVDQFHVNPDQIFLIGQSAGGHMVSLAATLQDGPFARTGGWQDASNRIAAVVSVAANYDLPSLSWGQLWRPLAGDPQQARANASPVNHVSADMPPILIIHSDDDRSVPVENALLMTEALNRVNAPYEFVRYTDAGHMGMTDAIVRESMKFIQKTINNSSVDHLPTEH